MMSLLQRRLLICSSLTVLQIARPSGYQEDVDLQMKVAMMLLKENNLCGWMRKKKKSM
jgi:hypothetical protein